MSHVRVKTKYNTEGSYGTTEERTLYADHNNCCDYVTYYDENGNVIFSYPDTIDNNLFDAIVRLTYYYKNDEDELVDNVEYSSREEINNLSIKKQTVCTCESDDNCVDDVNNYGDSLKFCMKCKCNRLK